MFALLFCVFGITRTISVYYISMGLMRNTLICNLYLDAFPLIDLETYDQIQINAVGKNLRDR